MNLDTFYQDYKTDRKFKSGDKVIYNHYELGNVNAIVLAKPDKVFADIAFEHDGKIIVEKFISTKRLMKSIKEEPKQAIQTGGVFFPRELDEEEKINWEKVIEDFFKEQRDLDKFKRKQLPFSPYSYPDADDYKVTFRVIGVDEYPRC